MSGTSAGGNEVSFLDQGFEDMRPRQDLPKCYIRSGSYYLNSARNIAAERRLPFFRFFIL